MTRSTNQPFASPAPVVDGRRRAPALRAIAPALLAAVLAGCAGSGWNGPPGSGAYLSRTPLEAYVATRIDSLGRENPEVEVNVPFRSLVFRRVGGRYRADVTATAVALRDGHRVGGGVANASAEAAEFAETRSRRQLTCRVPLLIEGEGAVEIQLTVQGRETSRSWRRVLAYRPQAARTIPLYFRQMHWNLEGEDGREGLGVTTDSLLVAVDLGLRPRHESWPDGGVFLTAKIDYGDKQSVGEQQVRIEPGDLADGGVVEHLAWAARDLPFGTASLAIALVGVTGDSSERLTLDPPRRFANLMVPWWDDREWKRQVGWLEGLVGDQERDRLRDLPEGERLAAWRDVWSTLATGREAEARDLERRHEERIVEADARFGGLGRGALTDRGRIYIRYGPPDRVETYGDDMTREGHWEIWYYLDARIRFTFYDPHGLGDYYLYDSGSI